MDKESIIILMADDDLDDRMLTKDAFDESHVKNPLHFVDDGVELLEYLKRQGKFQHLKDTPLPGLILLDLNMPRKDGREVLKEVKNDSTLKHIPVVVLTTSKQEEDIFNTYRLGCSGFISKPVKFDGLMNVIQSLKHYWIEIVEIPVSKREVG